MQLRKYRIRYGRIHHVFISHLHGDHVFGLYGLLSSLNLSGRKSPLALYAPAGFREIMIRHLSDFDIQLNFEIDFVPLKGDNLLQIYENRSIKVYSFPLKHRVPSYGFLFREKEKERKMHREAISKYNIPVSEIHKIKKGADFYTAEGERIPNEEISSPPPKPRAFAYCSDTMYFKRLAQFVSEVDLLYHEATFGSDLEALATRTGHSTAGQAARIASEAGAGKLVIGHFSARYRETDPLLNEARSVFPDTYTAEEGRVFQV